MVKKTLILFLIFVALGAFVYFYEYRGGQQREKAEELKGSLLKLERDDIESVSLIGGYEEDTITYVRVDSDNWRITSPVVTEAEKSAVSGNMSGFVNARIKRRLSIGSHKLQNFGLDPPVAKIIIETRDKKLTQLNVGHEAATRGDLFVSLDNLGGRDTVQVFVTGENVLRQAQKSLFDLRDKKIAHFDTDEVKTIELTSPEGEVFLEKSGEEWELLEPTGVRVSASRVRSFLNSVKNYSAKEYVQEQFEEPSPFGFDLPTVKLTLSLGEERSLKEIVIGNQSDDNELFYGYESGRSPVFLVRETTKKNLSKTPFYFQDQKIVKFDEGKVAEIRFSGGHKMTLTKEDTLGWYAYHDSVVKVDDSDMRRLFSHLRGLSAKELVTYTPERLDDYGLSQGPSPTVPFLEVVLVDTAAELGGFAVGDTVGNDRYIKSRDHPFVYLVSNSQVKRLTDWMEDVWKLE